jgi:Sec-independent protein translocase protein TatA
MKLGRGQILIVVILGLLLFGNLPRVLRETAASLRTRGSRVGLNSKNSIDEESKNSDHSKNPER